MFCFCIQDILRLAEPLRPSLPLFATRFLLFALIHSILASESVQQGIKRGIGSGFRIYRISYNVISLLLIWWIMSAYPAGQVIYALTGLVSLTMRALQGLLLLTLVICAAQTGIADFIGIASLSGEQHSSKLITGGCYKSIRHPQYLAATVLMIVNPRMTDSWAVLTALCASYFVIGAVIEESRLAKKFGSSYHTYRQSTGMFLPRWHNRS